MSQPSFQEIDWYQSLSLTERIALLKTAQSGFEINSDLAQCRTERWKSQTPFNKDDYFAQRLGTENISEEEFLSIRIEPSSPAMVTAKRQGVYLAILYALEATDFHHENLIAVGEHPILLDLEALFHPRVGGMDLKQADQLANSTPAYSVYGIGLLPQRFGRGRGAIDASPVPSFLRL
jgi:hypothetical protein